MTPEVEIPKQYSTLTEWCEALAKQGKNAREIRQETNCSKSTAYNAIKKADKEKEQGKTQPSKVTVTPIRKEVPQIEEAPKVEPAEPAEGIDRVAGKLIAGAILDSEDLEYLFHALNDLFPPDLKRPDKSMKLLGKVWYKPANRILQEYLEENVDIYFASIVTIVVFAPGIYAILKKQFGKKPEKKE